MPLLGSDTSVTAPFPKGMLLLETLAGREMRGRPFLGVTTQILEGQGSTEPSDLPALAVATYRSVVGDDHSENSDLLDEAAAVHDDQDE